MDVRVKTKYGEIAGERKKGYSIFLGVPYAQPPVGERRFRRPQPPEPWKEVLDAKRYPDYSFQPKGADTCVRYTKGSEDCLKLNIYTPACDSRRRPVVVWIHGGAYLTGTNSSICKYGGKLCIDSDIVVVTIGYRLGALGFVDFGLLSGSRGRFERNCGTWDQTAAVMWVIENIAAFGGDPDNITLMGESAGGTSVLTLMTTPYLKGKIRQAVLESPAPHLIQTEENARKAALDIAERLGIAEKDAYQIADLPAEVLTKAVEESEYDYVNRQPYLLPTAPSVDGDLIPELPYDALMHGKAEGIRVLIGTTKDEGSIFAAGRKNDIFPADESQLNRFFADNPQADHQAILSLYTDYPSKKAFQEIGKEIFFHVPVMEMAYHLAKTNSVYLYHFDYAFPMLKLLGAGSAHCTNSALTAGVKPTGIYKFFKLFSGKAGEMLTSYIHTWWGNFIAHGNPNGEGVPLWPECNEKKSVLFINRECHVENEPFEEIRKAYGEIYPYGN